MSKEIEWLLSLIEEEWSEDHVNFERASRLFASMAANFELLISKTESQQDIIENQQKEIKALEDAATDSYIEDEPEDFDPYAYVLNEENRLSEQE
tara:strand:+ start:14896 stop:15180 length:285 start_codon:yes stop_codon:yes gene_type:complete